MRVILHVGTDKTGSTSLQRMLYANETELSKGQLLYSDGVIDWHNDKPLFRAFCSDFAAFPETKEADIKENQAYSEKYLLSLETRLKNLSEKDTLLLSHEGLMGLSQHDLKRMQGFISKYVSDIKIILYARDVASYAVSAKSQRAKTGRAESSFKPPFIKYSNILDNFEKVFGVANIEVRQYGQSPSFEIVTDFFKSKWLSSVDNLSNINLQESPDVVRNYSLNSSSYAVAKNIAYLSNRRWSLAEFKGKFLSLLGDIPGEKLGINLIEKIVLSIRTKKHLDALSRYNIYLQQGRVSRSLLGLKCSRIKALLHARNIMLEEGVPISKGRFAVAVIVSLLRDFLCSPWLLASKKP